ncbi:MAG: type II toxin-antitoxin system RelE/ParE family toxin [Pseudomonadota bacterium]
MIKNFTYKGLWLIYESDTSNYIIPQHITRVREIIALLETAETVEDMDLPGLGLHPVIDKKKDTWAVNVSRYLRITFKIQNGDAFDVNYEGHN